MKRFDFAGSKLSHNIDFPKKFSFEKEFMNDELAKHESHGWLDMYNHTKSSFFAGLQRETAPVQQQPEEQQPEEKFKHHAYELNSMIVHHGFRSGAGHYYSIIKVQTNKDRAETRWVKFDDDKITFIEENEIDSYSQKAYLLFYQQVWVYPPQRSKRKLKRLLP